MNEQLFTVDEVSEQFKVTRQTVYNWITAGKLDVIRVGRSIRIPASALDRFLSAPAYPEGQKATPAAAGVGR